MNTMILGIGDGKSTYSIIQSITRNCPIVCSSREVRKSLVSSGKILCERLYPGDGRVTMPTPVTFEEFESGEFNKSVEYIFDSLDEYFKYKGIKVKTVMISKE